MLNNIMLTVSDLSYLRLPWLFANLNFHLKSSELLLIEGSNGSGKTTLLHILAGFNTAYEGKVVYEKPLLGKNDCHYLGHQFGLKLDLTVLENLKLYYLSALRPFSLQSCLSVCEHLNLTKYLHLPARHLSAGQKKRLALARLWLIDRPLWLLDEPLSALDDLNRGIFLTKVKEHLSGGGSIAMSSHQALGINYPYQKLNLSLC